MFCIKNFFSFYYGILSEIMVVFVDIFFLGFSRELNK